MNYELKMLPVVAGVFVVLRFLVAIVPFLPLLGFLAAGISRMSRHIIFAVAADILSMIEIYLTAPGIMPVVLRFFGKEDTLENTCYCLNDSTSD